MTNAYSSKDLSHHGIVAVVCKEIGLIDVVDQIIPPDSRAEMTIGECVQLMVINGLGFSARPLYLQSQFFENKPIGRLLGRDIDAEQISDDRLGRCLDRCYEAGCNQIFTRIASKASLKYGVDQKFKHLDTTSMSVCGEYNEDEGIGLIKFGYSKDHRPDLKQFMISLVSSKDGDVPLLAQTIPGNSSDKTHFLEVLKALKSEIDPEKPEYHVTDSALYVEESIKELSPKMKWITRVPEVIKSVKDLISRVSRENMESVGNGYYISEVGNQYAGVHQRWLVVFSEQAYKRESATLERHICKEGESKFKELKRLQSHSFGCKSDAQAALKAFEKKAKYHRCTNIEIIEKQGKRKPGRPAKGSKAPVIYSISARLERDEKEISKLLNRKGKFIVATNELDETKLSTVDLLDTYKGQQCVERGFRFLKDPLFMTQSVFLKKQERIIALSMIMCLCLLVYTLAQRILRIHLSLEGETVSDQRGQATSKPTMRWIFQMFEGIHLLLHRTESRLEELVLNLTAERMRILDILGPPFLEMYKNSA